MPNSSQLCQVQSRLIDMSWRSKNGPCSVGTWSFGLSNQKTSHPSPEQFLVLAVRKQRLGKHAQKQKMKRMSYDMKNHQSHFLWIRCDKVTAEKAAATFGLALEAFFFPASSFLAVIPRRKAETRHNLLVRFGTSRRDRNDTADDCRLCALLSGKWLMWESCRMNTRWT